VGSCSTQYIVLCVQTSSVEEEDELTVVVRKKYEPVAIQDRQVGNDEENNQPVCPCSRIRPDMTSEEKDEPGSMRWIGRTIARPLLSRRGFSVEAA
jgi:hypothetical protein